MSTTYKRNYVAYASGISGEFNSLAAPSVDSIDANHWTKGNMFIQEKETWDLKTGSTAGYNRHYDIEIDKRFDKLGKIELLETRSAVAADTSGSSFTWAFHDWEPYTSIDKIEFLTGTSGKVFWTVYPQWILFYIYNCLTTKERAILAEACAGETTHAERLLLAVSAQSYRIKLFLPWEHMNKNLIQSSLNSKIIMRVYKKAFIDCGYCSNTGYTPLADTNATITNVSALGEGLLKLGQEKAMLFDMGLKNIFDYKVLDMEIQENEQITSGATKYTIKLNNLKNDMAFLFFTIRPSTNVPQGTASTTTNPLSYIKAGEYHLEDTNKKMMMEINDIDFETSGEFHEMFPLASMPSPWHVIPFCPRGFVEASYFNAYGSRNMVNYNNPTLVLNFASALSVNCVVDIYGMSHQILKFGKGTIRKVIGM